MENKLTKLGNTIKNNIHKTVPAFVLLTSLCFAKPSSASAETKYKNYKETPHIELTALGEKAAAKQNAINTYSARSAEKTLKEIINSDLNKITAYSYDSEKEVEKKLANHLLNLCNDGLKLSTAYKKLEDKTIAESGKTPEEITQIARDESVWKTASNDIKSKVVSISLQDDLHTDIDVLTLIRFNATKGEILVMDEHDSRYDRIDLVAKNGKIDMRKDTMSIINNATVGSTSNYNKEEFNIPDSVHWFYNSKGQNGQAIQQKLETLYKEIINLASKDNLTENEYNDLLKKCDEAADILYETGTSDTNKTSPFGTKAMCRGISYQIASSSAIVKTLNHLAKLGYKIEINLDAGEKNTENTPEKKSQKGSFNFGVGTTMTNERMGANVNLGGTFPLNNQWDMNCLVKGLFLQSTKGNVQDSIQLLGGIGGNFTTKSQRSTFGLTAEAGAEFTKNNVDFLIGGNASYEYKATDNLKLRVFTEIISNLEQRTTDYKAGLGISVKLSNGAIFKWDNDFGYTDIRSQNINLGTKPGAEAPTIEQLPDEPPYGGDEVIPTDDDTTDKGTDLPTKPADLTQW